MRKNEKGHKQALDISPKCREKPVIPMAPSLILLLNFKSTEMKNIHSCLLPKLSLTDIYQTNQHGN